MEKEYEAGNTIQSKKAVPHFATYIASLTDARIAGVFLERQGEKLQPVLRNINEMNVNPFVTANTSRTCCGKCKQKDKALEPPCNKEQAEPRSVTEETKAIIKESRFSDLLILDAEMSLDMNQTGVLSALTKEVLAKSECPVMIAPYAFDEIEEIIFAYDGSASAVFAIKQFACLFSKLTDKKLTVLQVTDKENESITDRHNILTLLQTHYSAVGFRILTGIASDELYSYLREKQNAIVVMGAFGEHLLEPFRESTAGRLVKTINLPLFTAHHQ